ncbi:DHHC palmitoyltransferase-domain-containing protein, partial [Zychaea mexicana]|uniref:DHHC palmitoyltransferase-domain-containing protein n=1 Tax=Zychaea mexicana TaxID=64656 RepID=UPI0022FDE9A4
WCDKCEWWKPDRAHHCRVCDTCVLRMDQVNGCVGFANYRYFIQFICYASGIAAWVFTTSLAAFIMGNGL